METEAEQVEYVQAQRAANLQAPLDLVQWQHFLKSPSWLETGTTVTAFKSEKVIGSVAVYRDREEIKQFSKRVGVMDNVFVDKDWRKRGVASYLVYQGLLYLKENGMEMARIGVRANNKEALGLYMRMGYFAIRESKVYTMEI